MKLLQFFCLIIFIVAVYSVTSAADRSDAQKSADTVVFPTMTDNYSSISATVLDVNTIIWPLVDKAINKMLPLISALSDNESFIIADYGCADGKNSEPIMLQTISKLKSLKPNIKIEIVYIDLAPIGPFISFYERSKLKNEKNVSVKYISQSFYQPVLGLKAHLIYSFSAFHWLDTQDKLFSFSHPAALQPNLVTGEERLIFKEKWQKDWQANLELRKAECVEGGCLVLANLSDFGSGKWPAAPAYKALSDVCQELHLAGKITDGQLAKTFISAYFPTPKEWKRLPRDLTIMKAIEHEIPCYYVRNPARFFHLPTTLAQVTKAWSYSSLLNGLNSEKVVGQDVVSLLDKIFNEMLPAKLAQSVAKTGLPYQYTFMLIRRS